MTVTVHLPTQIEAITLPAFLQVFADEPVSYTHLRAHETN